MPDWMAFNIDDYVSNTLHLTTRQHGGYILLICAAWKAKGRLPGADAALMAIAKLTPKEWKEDGEALKAFLTRNGDGWVHERVMFEWNEADSLISAKSKGGKKGAKKRWEGRTKTTETPNDTPIGHPSQKHRTPTDTPNTPLQEPLPGTVTTTPSAADSAAADFALADQAHQLWLTTASDLGIPDPGFMNGERRSKFFARMAEAKGDIELWKRFLRLVREAEFLRESNGKPKRWVNLGTLLDPENFTGVLEERYRHIHVKPAGADRPDYLEAFAHGAATAKQPTKGILDP